MERICDVPLRSAGPASPGREGAVPRYVIQLPATSADLAGAVDLAYALARSVGFLPQIDAGQTTVCAEDAPHVRHRVCCDRLLSEARRCGLRTEHDGPCAAEPPG
ncbi:hypothetical protein Pen02_20540 [Plantactinospora endophytica]|uniref:Uncharacterized protein n=1 Tax=Plantactinospora endophytica TaxID=673535 RepID=A0ABQ4DXD0_9ACTN|nr:hypothetical protein Pen02_20540 [Plantactinospora endophytica]